MDTGFEAELLTRQADRESNARTYPRGLPLAIAQARGVEVLSVGGKRYLDFFAGAGVLALGHSHPAIVEVVRAQLDKVVHALDLATEARDAFVTELLRTLPKPMRDTMRVHVCAPTGSDAIEAAIKLCKRATRRTGVVAFRGSYHGMTNGALAVTSLVDVKERLGGWMPDVSFMPHAYCARCPVGLARPTCQIACATALETALEDTHSGLARPACVLVEPVQGEGGTVVPPREFIQRIRRASASAGAPFVVDEVQSGLGRTGRMWAFEHFDIEPDVIATSKALGGIGLPIAAILYRRELDVWEPGTHIGTFRGHQLAMAAGAAAMRIIREDGLLENAVERGGEILSTLQTLRCPYVREVRGLGLMIGVELAHPETGAPIPEIATRVRRACFDRGLLVELGGRADSTVRLLPPLVLTRAQALEGASTLCAALRAI